MANKRIRKKWQSRMRKDAQKLATRFKIPRQIVGAVGEGAIPGRWEVAGTIGAFDWHDEVREITDFHLESISFIPLEETLHPSWHLTLPQTQQHKV